MGNSGKARGETIKSPSRITKFQVSFLRIRFLTRSLEMIELTLAHKYERKRIRDWADRMVSEKLEMGGRLVAFAGEDLDWRGWVW